MRTCRGDACSLIQHNTPPATGANRQGVINRGVGWWGGEQRKSVCTELLTGRCRRSMLHADMQGRGVCGVWGSLKDWIAGTIGVVLPLPPCLDVRCQQTAVFVFFCSAEKRSTAWRIIAYLPESMATFADQSRAADRAAFGIVILLTRA